MVKYFNTKDKNFWSIPYNSDTDQQGAQGQFTANLENYRITVGIDWVEYDMETNGTPGKYSFDNPACYLLGKAKFFDQRLILSAGLRYDEYEVQVTKPEGNKESDENFSPRLGVAYLLTDYLKLRVNYGEAFKMPDAKELAGNFDYYGRHYVGNPDLDVETSRTYEGGIDLFYASFNAFLTYFYTNWEDMIETCYLDTGDYYSWDNVADATISGFEGELSYDFGSLPGWDIEVKPYVNFVYLTKYEDEEEKEDLMDRSDLTASYGISISDYDSFSTSLNFAYTGEKDIKDIESGSRKRIKADDFTVADFMISKRILKTERYGGLTLRGKINNLFDKDYEYCQGYPMPGRSFFIGMRYDY